MSGLEKRGGSRPSRRAREQRAFRLVQVGGAAGLVTVVGAVLAILGILGWSLARDRRRDRGDLRGVVPPHGRQVGLGAAALPRHTS